MRVKCFFLLVLVSLVLSTPVLSQTAPAAVPTPEVSYGSSSVEWPLVVPEAGTVLTISGPEGLYLKQEQAAGSAVRFNLRDDQGQVRPDGVYKWELSVPGSPTRSGSFEMRAGAVVAEQSPDEKQPVVLEAGAPANALYVDREGRVGLGTSIPAARLHLKGTDPSLAIEDTAAGGREYRLRSRDSGDGSLGLFEEKTGEARWLVDSEGRMGINTTKPTSTLTVDGYIETTKGFLVNGRPIGAVGGWIGARPLSTEGASNNFFGTGAGASNAGILNSFFGSNAGTANTLGNYNCFFGSDAGLANTTGSINSFYGYYAGHSNEAGNSNSFFGAHAGFSNIDGNDNSFYGFAAGYHNTSGYSNSFLGRDAGSSNTTGWGNSFVGRDAGFTNMTGNYNSFFGYFAGKGNTTGTEGSFFGRQAGFNNTTGSQNSFFGLQSGYSNTVESGNSFLGAYADLYPGTNPATNPVINATAVGYRSYVSRSNSVVLGAVNGFNGAFTETFVGIGTIAPDRQLVVEGSQALGKFRRYNATGASFSPAFLFERGRGTNTAPTDILAGDYLGKVQFRGRVSGNYPEYGAFAFIATDTIQNGRFSFLDRDLATERMVILNTGNVGIGTTTPTELLDVAGNLRVRGSMVSGAPAVPVPDYVFESDYRLRPLAEVEQYVRSEKHLPNIPKASEIQEKGVNIGEFQMKLLEKVEELTLYAVEQAKMIEQQKQEIETLKQMVKEALRNR